MARKRRGNGEENEKGMESQGEEESHVQFFKGALLLGVDLAGLIPLLIIVMITLVGGGMQWGHILFIVPACIAFIGIIALFFLLRSEMATQYLGQANASLRHNVEGKIK